jgi:hypothetical protein
MNKNIIFVIASLMVLAQASWAASDDEGLVSSLKNIETISDRALKSGNWANKCSAVVLLEEQLTSAGPTSPVQIANVNLKANVDRAYMVCANPNRSYNGYQFVESMQTVLPNNDAFVTATLRQVRAEVRHMSKSL